MTKLRLLYAGYADYLAGQFGGPQQSRPIPLFEGVLGYFLRDEPRLHGFHVEHFQRFNSWESLKELLGEVVTDLIHEFHQEVSPRELPALSGLSEEELRMTMQQSVVRREFEVDWPDDSEVAERLQGIVLTWESGD